MVEMGAKMRGKIVVSKYNNSKRKLEEWIGIGEAQEKSSWEKANERTALMTTLSQVN